MVDFKTQRSNRPSATILPTNCSEPWLSFAFVSFMILSVCVCQACNSFVWPAVNSSSRWRCAADRWLLWSDSSLYLSLSWFCISICQFVSARLAIVLFDHLWRWRCAADLWLLWSDWWSLLIELLYRRRRPPHRGSLAHRLILLHLLSTLRQLCEFENKFISVKDHAMSSKSEWIL